LTGDALGALSARAVFGHGSSLIPNQTGSVSNKAGAIVETKVAFLLAVVMAFPSSYASSKPVKSSTLLSADEVAIYKAILQQYGANDSGALNVSATTVPLNPDSPTSGLSRDGCLQGVQLENLDGASHSFHELPPEILLGTNAKLVDPKKHAKIAHANDPDKTMRQGKSVEDAVKGAFANGLFSMTEVGFDKDHHYAVVGYSFWCGSLCGHGRTLVFEKVNGVWRNANRTCGGWVS
jgi:hypothetical protein